MPSVLLTDSISVELGAQEPWPNDVKLFQQYEVEQILLPDNANCLAVQAFLKMCHLNFSLDMRGNAEHMSPSVYVDLVLACSDEKMIEDMKLSLSKSFAVKDMGSLHYFLGVKVLQNSDGSIWIGQPSFARSILVKFFMEDCKATRTPASTSEKLSSSTENSKEVNRQLYQSAVGSLLYLSIATRPDITYAVSNVAKYCSNPTQEHWTAVKTILRYLKGTENFGILYSKSSNHELYGYSDADWAGDINDRRSTSGYLFMMDGAPISWRSKKQSCVALSTAEAEYVALANAVQEAVWLKQLCADLNFIVDTPMLIYEDNQSAISIAKNPQYHGRTKHIDIKFHFVRSQISLKSIKIMYCPTDEMIADILTKPLSFERFQKFRNMMNLIEI